MNGTTARLLGLATGVLLLGGCRTERPPLERAAPRASEAMRTRTSAFAAGIPLPEARPKNPYEGDVHAINEGKRLYGWFNCAGCHGAIGGGAIGPPLRDRSWIYGGDAGQIYQTILEGRPNGMPAYGGRLPEDAAWKIVAYVQSLGGTPAAREPGAVGSEPEETEEHGPR
jgi:cytochrome c oxidase cbb3-type subunit III